MIDYGVFNHIINYRHKTGYISLINVLNMSIKILNCLTYTDLNELLKKMKITKRDMAANKDQETEEEEPATVVDMARQDVDEVYVTEINR